MRIVIRITALLMALASAILAYSDQIKPIADLSPGLAHVWMFFSIGAGIVSKGGLAAMGLFEKWQEEDAPTIKTPPASVIAGALLVMLFGSGCAWYNSLPDQRKAQITSTGSYITQKVVSTLGSVVLSAALNQVDSTQKIDIAQGLAYGLRSNEGSLVTADDIKSITAIWTPDKPHWQEFGNDIANIYQQAAPSIATVIQKGDTATEAEKTDAIIQSSKAIEQIAVGIDKATK